jgi:hypothetical protein
MQRTIGHATSTDVSRPAPTLRWEVWLLRAVLAASATYAVIRGEKSGAVAALLALVLTWAPAVIAGRGGLRAPRLIEVLWALALTMPAASDALGMYERVTYWGKLVHGLEGGFLAGLAALLLVGYADRAELGLPRQLAALAAVCVGITAGVVWEFVEFVIDWVSSADLQKSNADTMTDLLWSNLAALGAAALAVRVYHHVLDDGARTAIGGLGECLFTPIGHFLDRHGKLAFALMVLLIAASIAGLWFTGRPVPGLPIE